MRIKRITLRNYRQYKDLELEFPKNKRIFLFIGKNGTGKSNFLNAINWCFYGDEPFGATGLKGFATAHKGAKKGEDVEVEIEIESDMTSYIVQRRMKIGAHTSELTVFEKDITSNMPEVQENPNNIINRYLPKEIRNFFFSTWP